jgi:hypothetical protein
MKKQGIVTEPRPWFHKAGLVDCFGPAKSISNRPPPPPPNSLRHKRFWRHLGRGAADESSMWEGAYPVVPPMQALRAAALATRAPCRQGSPTCSRCTGGATDATRVRVSPLAGRALLHFLLHAGARPTSRRCQCTPRLLACSAYSGRSERYPASRSYRNSPPLLACSASSPGRIPTPGRGAAGALRTVVCVCVREREIERERGGGRWACCAMGEKWGEGRERWGRWALCGSSWATRVGK